MAITKATLASNVFTTFFNLINSNVTNPQGGAKWIFSDMPDRPFDDDTNYPIIIISPVNFVWENFKFTSKRAMLEVRIDVLGTNWGTTNSGIGVDAYFDEIINLVESSRDTLRGDGLKFVQLASTEFDTYERGKIKVHERRIVFEMEYDFDTTNSY